MTSEENREKKSVPAGTKRLMVLAIDDDPVTLETINECLGHACIVLLAPDAQEGIELALHHKPDVVLLDIMMPVMDGISALMLLKSDENTDKIPVIMVSALRKKSKIVEAFNEGAADYVVKPFTADSLIRKICKVLGPAADGLKV